MSWLQSWRVRQELKKLADRIDVGRTTVVVTFDNLDETILTFTGRLVYTGRWAPSVLNSDDLAMAFIDGDEPIERDEMFYPRHRVDAYELKPRVVHFVERTR